MKKEALKHLMTNTLRPTEEALWDQALNHFEQIIKEIPIYLLDASLSTSAVKSIKKAIYNE